MGSFTPLIKACTDSSEAETLLTRMVKEQVVPDTTAFNAALHSAVQAKNLAQLWRIYDMMEASGVAPDAATYTTLALLYARCGDTERAEDIMFKSHLEGHARGPREYDILLSAYGN